MTPGRQVRTGEWVGADEGKVHEAGRRGPDRRVQGPDQDSQRDEGSKGPQPGKGA